MIQKAPEYIRTFSDHQLPQRCPACESIDLARWDHKTTVSKQCMKFRDYMICKDCLFVWQWVTPLELSSSKEHS